MNGGENQFPVWYSEDLKNAIVESEAAQATVEFKGVPTKKRARVLRISPNIKWDKDRGKEPVAEKIVSAMRSQSADGRIVHALSAQSEGKERTI